MALDEAQGNALSSSTAEGALSLRAAAASEPDPAVRSPDDLAAAFLPWKPRLTSLAKVPGIRRLVPRLLERILPGAYWFEVGRTKHMDAVLREELLGGAQQVVILGAGFDSRAYRLGTELAGVRVFEVDHPVTAAAKRERVAAVVGDPPSNVTYVEIDFNSQDLGERLRASGFDENARSFVIWSGVTVYLEEAGVEATLSWFARHTAPGSSIVFDYAFREMIDGDDAFYGARELRKRVAAGGEPLLFGIPRGQTGVFLEERGLRLVSDLGPDDAKARYITRSDGTLAGEGYGFGGIAHARRPEPV